MKSSKFIVVAGALFIAGAATAFYVAAPSGDEITVTVPGATIVLDKRAIAKTIEQDRTAGRPTRIIPFVLI